MKMKKTILFVLLSMMTCFSVMAQEQEKGPVVVETENFSVKVPKGWVVKKKSTSGRICSVTLAPEVKPDVNTNFGFDLDIWSFVSKTYTVEKIIDDALHQYGENATEKKEDIKFGSNVFQRTYFNEGYGSSQVLALPLKEEGALSVSVHTYSLDNKDIKAILKSLKVNR